MDLAPFKHQKPVFAKISQNAVDGVPHLIPKRLRRIASGGTGGAVLGASNRHSSVAHPVPEENAQHVFSVTSPPRPDQPFSTASSANMLTTKIAAARQFETLSKVGIRSFRQKILPQRHASSSARYCDRLSVTKRNVSQKITRYLENSMICRVSAVA
jgi:hypothetical protein